MNSLTQKAQLKVQKQAQRFKIAHDNLVKLHSFVYRVNCNDIKENKDLEIKNALNESISKFKDIYKYSKNQDIKKMIKMILSLLDDINRIYSSLVENIKLQCDGKNKSLFEIIKIKKNFIIDYLKQLDPVVIELHKDLNYGLRAEGIIDEVKSSKTNMTGTISI